jgi:GMP synthase-like glutamine amidotransferase
MKKTVGILMCNTDVSGFAQQHPLDGEKFTSLIHAVRPDWTVKIYDATQGIFPASPSECDGYVMTGSPASVNEDRPWMLDLFIFIRAMDSATVPAVGCCFGHQAIAKALGGEVSRNPGGWSFGTAQTHFQKHESWMQPAADTLTLFSAHNEQVTVLPKGAVVLGANTFCPAASYQIGTQFFTTQYHPEMTADFMTALSHEVAPYVGDDLAKAARKQAKLPTHGHEFAEWMVRFLELPR